MAATEAPEVERVKEVLQPSLHVLESARSSNGDITLLPAEPEAANCPLIAAVQAAEEIKMPIFDGGHRIILSQQSTALHTVTFHCLSSLPFITLALSTPRAVASKS
jgi:hypothetical protein